MAEGQADANLQPGAATVMLRFNYTDLVESGPYRLVNVMAYEPDPHEGKVLAAAQTDVGRVFAGLRPGTGIEPVGQQPDSVKGLDPYLRNVPTPRSVPTPPWAAPE